MLILLQFMQQIETPTHLTECRLGTQLYCYKLTKEATRTWPHEALRFLLLNDYSLPYVGPAALISV